MSGEFSARPTRLGLSKVTNGQLSGNLVKVTHFAVGDGNEPPSVEQTALQNEKYRGLISFENVSADNPLAREIECIVPATSGAYFIREIGLFDSDGDLVALAKTPSTEMVPAESGGATDAQIIVELFNSYAENLEFVFDPHSVTASRAWVNGQTDVLHLRLMATTFMAASAQLRGFDRDIDPLPRTVEARLQALERRPYSLVPSDLGEDPHTEPVLAPIVKTYNIRPNIYVDQANGSDDGVRGGRAPEYPLRSITEALANVQPNEHQKIIILGRYHLEDREVFNQALGYIEFIGATSPSGNLPYIEAFWSNINSQLLGFTFNSIDRFSLRNFYRSYIYNPSNAPGYNPQDSLFTFNHGFDRIDINDVNFQVDGFGEHIGGVHIGGVMNGHIEFGNYAIISGLDTNSDDQTGANGRVLQAVGPGGDPNAGGLTSNITQLGDPI